MDKKPRSDVDRIIGAEWDNLEGNPDDVAYYQRILKQEESEPGSWAWFIGQAIEACLTGEPRYAEFTPSLHECAANGRRPKIRIRR